MRSRCGPTAIEVVCAGDEGLFHAAITLMTLRETHGAALPCGVIRDAPRFGWRGQHLDCARHFYRVETILRLLDLMALLKLNRFHWHFSDDEAFRLQVNCAPEIWQRTELRGEGHLVPGVFGGGIESGGSYSQGRCRADSGAGEGAAHRGAARDRDPRPCLCAEPGAGRDARPGRQLASPFGAGIRGQFA